MMRGKLVFITGGARSGKSSFAERLAETLDKSMIYLATAEALDDEMKQRVINHRKRRGNKWVTVEEPIDVERVIEEYDNSGYVILLDCLTLWITNLVLKGGNPCSPEEMHESDAVLNRVKALAEITRDSRADVIVVSNEVGMGIVPGNAVSRIYRDVQGRSNQVFARKADEVYFMVAGLPVEISAGARHLYKKLKLHVFPIGR